ncbi:glycosyltransferase family 4 protein [Bacteroidota bacterium]
MNARFLTKKVTGIERYAAETSLLLKHNLPDLRYITHKDIIHKNVAKELDAREFGVLKGHLWEQVELPVYCFRQKKPTLLNLMNTGPIIYQNQIVVIHDVAFLRHPEWYSRKAYRWFKFVITRLVKNSRKIVTCSNFSKSEIIELLNVPENKVEVIYPTIPNIMVDLSKNDYSNKYGKYILAVSTLEPRKNLINLVKAFTCLEDEEIKLLVVGTENKRVFAHSRIRSLAAQNKNIQFLGYVENEQLAALYQHAMVLVYPSIYEGFGYPPLEAMVFNCPVIVANSSSLPEVCGENALYVNPSDSDDIAEKINHIVDSKDPHNYSNPDHINKYLPQNISPSWIKLLESC